ncbi:hypothetical protein J6590_067988 [Homalodisca vitripennis]|nr:hypothetical protein J6590_067988 [Homalodisca vitripennis]
MCLKQRLISHTDIPLMSLDFFGLRSLKMTAISTSPTGNITMEETGQVNDIIQYLCRIQYIVSKNLSAVEVIC